VKLSEAQARALEAAARGELRRWNDAPGFVAGGKTYAVGHGTIQKGTVESLTGSQPPLLTEGEQDDRAMTWQITACGRAELAAHRAPYRQHRGKARPR